MSLNKLVNLKVSPGAKSSRFVIDLKQDRLAAEAKEKEINKNNLIVESKLEKLAELDYKKYYGAGKDKAKAAVANFKSSIFKINARAKQPKVKRAQVDQGKLSRRSNWDYLSDELAFVALGKLLFTVFKILFYWLNKACYALGWVIVFILRFVFLALAAMLKPAKKTLANFFGTAVKFSNLFVSVYESAHSATLSLALIFFGHRSSKKLRKQANRSDELQNPPSPLLPVQAGYQGGIIKPVVAFALVLLVIAMPLKAYTYYKTIDHTRGRVLGASESAINDLISGGQAAAQLDFGQADKKFSLAENNFLTAQNQLAEVNSLLFTIASIIPNKNIQLAAASKHIVRAGELSSAAGRNLTLATANLVNFTSGDSGKILTDFSSYGHEAAANVRELTGELEQINNDAIPANYLEQFTLLKQKLAEFGRWLDELTGLADSLKIFLGENSAKRYLLVFQNNSELRASGGFIGSFATIDFLHGKIKKLEAPGGGSYDTDAGLLKKIKSPEPLALVRPDWHFWDANWWPDWPTSAKKLAWFYENSDGSTVDGVIGLTPTVIERILKVIGPIDLTAKYGLTIDADNFWVQTQTLSEQKPNVTKKPKLIIGDLMNKIIKELPRRLSKNNLAALLNALSQSLNDKNILFYFSDSELEAKAKAWGADGSIKDAPSDYLSVINTNIAGGKSDRRIKQAVKHRAQVLPDGSIIDNLTIERTHEGLKREPFSGVRNVDWLRIYVPEGAKLISAEGFSPLDKIFFKTAQSDWQIDADLMPEANAFTDESSGTKIYNEFGKTVFANWSQVDPGETTVIKIKYSLPFKLTDKPDSADQELTQSLLAKAGALIKGGETNLSSYSLLAQKQPGMNSSTFVSELVLSDNFKPVWKSPESLSQNQTGWFRSENFEQDILSAIIVAEN